MSGSDSASAIGIPPRRLSQASTTVVLRWKLYRRLTVATADAVATKRAPTATGIARSETGSYAGSKAKHGNFEADQHGED